MQIRIRIRDGSVLIADADQRHDVLEASHLDDGEVGHEDPLGGVLTKPQVAVVGGGQQVTYVLVVDLEVAEHDRLGAVWTRGVDVLEELEAYPGDEAVGGRVPVEVPHHRIRLASSRLSEGKHATVEAIQDPIHHWLPHAIEDSLLVSVMVRLGVSGPEHSIKDELP